MKRFEILMLLAMSVGGEVACSKSEDGGTFLDPDTQITLLDGFDAEIVYAVPPAQGSWVAMAFDPKGRLIVSDQDSDGVFRVTLPAEGAGEPEVQVERLEGFPYEPIPWGKRTVGGGLGFLYAFDSLYMSSMKGFYRIRDTDGDDQYDEFTRLKKLDMGYEHSAHCIVETEDGEALYLVSGNHSDLPEGIPSLQPEVWGEDSLLDSLPDSMGHAVGVEPPGGWICRISPDGEEWTMIASGFRNSVDLAINREGELFTADSDLEFDIGSPWYRPTRVNHVTSASEFGWRAGSAKWPEHFADGSGTVVDLGPGSPTGMSFGHHSNFPDEYQDKLFVCDWTFGTIYTIDMEERGSSYTGTKEVFLSGAPLNISAMRFGPDGHMYFLVGGRNTASKLYRVRHTGPTREGSKKSLAANQGLRDLRRSLEAFHGDDSGGAAAIESAWPHLSHADREIRYAARLALESQDLALWQERVFAEPNARAVVHAVIALCRHGNGSLSSRVLEKLDAVPFGSLERTDQLALLRAYSLCFIRLNEPTPAEVAAVTVKLDPFFPARDDALDTELCRVLSYLNAPSVVGKTIALMEATQTKALAYDEEMLTRHEYGKAILETMANTPNSQNIQYAYSLRRVRDGWTLEDRKTYFSWLTETLKKSGGKSFAGYVRAIRDDAIDHLPPEDAAAVSWLVGDVSTAIDLTTLPVPEGPPVAWTTDLAMELFEDDLEDRDFENGEKMFSAGGCVACHRFQGSGGYSGPDLGSVANRYSIRDILVAICEPSQSISEQYQASDVSLRDGRTVNGRVIYQNDEELALASNPYDFGELSRIPSEEVESVEPSQTSMMPPTTIFFMNGDELSDLMAYLMSGGDPDHAVFE